VFILTDHKDWTESLFPDLRPARVVTTDTIDDKVRDIAAMILGGGTVYKTAAPDIPGGEYFLAAKSAVRSQYDLLVNLIRNGVKVPPGLICLADSGQDFHGLRNRRWQALPGNIHLSLYLSPDCPIPAHGAAFTVLSAVSVIQAIDDIDELAGRARTKWVNDVIVERAKVCGVLTHSQAEGNRITAVVLGIGLNVESAPEIITDRFVPRTACLREFLNHPAQINQGRVLGSLLRHLDRNYRLIIDGQYRQLLDIYRRRSAIIGRNVEIYPDSPLDNISPVIRGRVSRIGDNLELFLDGCDNPVTRGRLALCV